MRQREALRKGMLQRITNMWFSGWRCAHGIVKTVEPWGILIIVIALLLSVVQFWSEYSDRVEERQVRAWQLITTIAPGNSGKIEALEYLNSEDGLLCFESLKGKLDWFHDDKGIKCLISLKSRVPLVGINLSRSENGAVDDSSTNLPGVFLVGVDLREAVLSDARLSGAILRGADLSGAILFGADLISANLSGVNLSGADLSVADLSGAILFGADLISANLFDADLSGAYLSGASLFDAYLSVADLSGAILFDANLSGADLSGASLFDANLSGAILSGADLSGADLSGADLSGALNLKSSQFDENTCGDSNTKLPKGLTIEFCE